MKIVVDTNIVFTAMLNPNAKVGQILIYGQQHFEFYAPQLLKEEIRKHKEKIIALSKHNDENDFEEIRDEILSCIRFISEEQIPYHYWHEAIPYVRGTDMDDLAFVVLTNYLDAKLWTGDKRLIAGLERAGYSRLIDRNVFSDTDFFDS
ncbi:MAG: hypothetical protein KF852_01685 [Saprospiraceae bacterium]|nr:hypothetical protein [Saprospiraceae bacterium]